MVARDVDALGRRLHELNEQTLEELALAGIAFGLAIAATQLRRDLAIPLLVGAMVLTALGLVALVRRRLLVEDAAGDRDAYELDAVRRYAERLAGRDTRREDAAQLRRILSARRPGIDRTQVKRLVRCLERDDLDLDPACAVVLAKLLDTPALPSDEFRSRLAQVEAGFHAR